MTSPTAAAGILHRGCSCKPYDVTCIAAAPALCSTPPAAGSTPDAKPALIGSCSASAARRATPVDSVADTSSVRWPAAAAGLPPALARWSFEAKPAGERARLAANCSTCTTRPHWPRLVWYHRVDRNGELSTAPARVRGTLPPAPSRYFYCSLLCLGSDTLVCSGVLKGVPAEAAQHPQKLSGIRFSSRPRLPANAQPKR